mmetsp:Transcript_62418/g.115886  ORF Transcript_62418/g.115886 Transcript_62418/m.115886 type:complete len:173 (-) Transcript_62418:109-627(-)
MSAAIGRVSEAIELRSWDAANVVPAQSIAWRLAVCIGQALLAVALLLYLCWEVRAVRECAGLNSARTSRRRLKKDAEEVADKTLAPAAKADSAGDTAPSIAKWVRADDVGPSPDVVPPAPVQLPNRKPSGALPRQRKDRSTSLDGSTRCQRKSKDTVRGTRGTRATSRRCRR